MALSYGFGLIHGGLHAGWCWSALMPHLRAPSIAVDLPGRTGLAADLARITHADWVASAAAQIATLQTPEIVLVAHSLGGITAPGVAKTLRARVRAMVFVAALIPPNGSSAGLQGIEAAGDVWPIPPAEICRALLCTGMPPDEADALLQRLTPEPASPLRHPVTRTGAPDVPILYVAGADDPTHLGAPEADRLRQDFSNVCFIQVPGGHNMMMTHPADLAAAIHTFLAAA